MVKTQTGFHNERLRSRDRELLQERLETWLSPQVIDSWFNRQPDQRWVAFVECRLERVERRRRSSQPQI